MAIQEIPKAYGYTCDGCGQYHKQTNANGHYTNSTPPSWMTVRLNFYDEKSIEKLFCDDCRSNLQTLIENWSSKK